MRKICVISGSRAEYGILKGLIKLIDQDNELELQIIASGMHVSERFGNTYKEILDDNLAISEMIDIKLISDTPSSVCNSIAIGVKLFSEKFHKLKPDLIVVLGDRFEILSSVISAMIMKIPIAHIHGGEITKESFDDNIRHSITKMSHIHFASTDIYRNRIIQMGENPKKVFNVGSLGVENIQLHNQHTIQELERFIGKSFLEKNILITFHPETLNAKSSHLNFKELLVAVSELKNTLLIFTQANSDPGGDKINRMIMDYVKGTKNSCFVKSFGNNKYLSVMGFVDVVLGNSSSGIIEAPSLKTPTVNIGNRQLGRIHADSVINVNPISDEILGAINKIYSKDFLKDQKIFLNPYEKNNTSKEILKVIKSTPLGKILIKDFYDIDNLKL